MPSGGARPGAGRPRKADAHARPIARAEKRIADKLPYLIDQMFELAAGVLVQEADGHGGTRIWDKPPDRAAIEYLLNRVMGKPTERVIHQGDDDAPPISVRTVTAVIPPGVEEPAG
jgi:CubicO group peptidase (beta-lactamase class C family)